MVFIQLTVDLLGFCVNFFEVRKEPLVLVSYKNSFYIQMVERKKERKKESSSFVQQHDMMIRVYMYIKRKNTMK